MRHTQRPGVEVEAMVPAPEQAGAARPPRSFAEELAEEARWRDEMLAQAYEHGEEAVEPGRFLREIELDAVEVLTAGFGLSRRRHEGTA